MSAHKPPSDPPAASKKQAGRRGLSGTLPLDVLEQMSAEVPAGAPWLQAAPPADAQARARSKPTTAQTVALPNNIAETVDGELRREAPLPFASAPRDGAAVARLDHLPFAPATRSLAETQDDAVTMTDTLSDEHAPVTLPFAHAPSMPPSEEPLAQTLDDVLAGDTLTDAPQTLPSATHAVSGALPFASAASAEPVAPIPPRSVPPPPAPASPTRPPLESLKETWTGPDVAAEAPLPFAPGVRQPDRLAAHASVDLPRALPFKEEKPGIGAKFLSAIGRGRS